MKRRVGKKDVGVFTAYHDRPSSPPADGDVESQITRASFDSGRRLFV